MGCAGHATGDDLGLGDFWLHHGAVGFKRHYDFAGAVAVLSGVFADSLPGAWRGGDGCHYEYSGGLVP